MFNNIKEKMFQIKLKRRQRLRDEVTNMINTLECVQRDIETNGITRKRAEYIEELGIRLSSIAHLCK